MATRLQRLSAYVIDLVPIVLFGAMTTVWWSGTDRPDSLRWVVAAYLLLRDVGGASIGKRIVGLRVVAAGGGEAGLGSRILRNATLALTPAAKAMSLSTPSAAQAVELVGSLVGGVDVLFILIAGHRLGDRLARTAVVRTAQ